MTKDKCIVDIWKEYWINPCTQVELKWYNLSGIGSRGDKACGHKTVSPYSFLKFVCKMSMIQTLNLRLRSMKSDIVMSQLLQFNWFVNYKEVHRYNKDIYTSVSVYMSMLVFGKTGKDTIKWHALWEWTQHFVNKRLWDICTLILNWLPTSLKTTVIYNSGLG